MFYLLTMLICCKIALKTVASIARSPGPSYTAFAMKHLYQCRRRSQKDIESRQNTKENMRSRRQSDEQERIT